MSGREKLMVMGFIFWSVVAIGMVVIGVISWRSKKPVGFFTGVKAPEVSDTVGYNHSVGTLWIVYGILLEFLGLPLLFMKQNSAGVVILILGTVFISIGLAVAFVFISSKYQKKG